jgi:hypothetical protein
MLKVEKKVLIKLELQSKAYIIHFIFFYFNFYFF